MQYFKGDAVEKKFVQSALPIIQAMSLQKDLFFAGAYDTAALGDVLYDSGRSPLSNAIARTIFRLSFRQIFDAFIVSGSFESYITVFKKIFGDSTSVMFTVPAPGKLNIAIVATTVELSEFVTRYIQNNAYIFDTMLTQDGDAIVFQTIKGFQSQYELQKMLFEMVPGGIFTNITLTIGT